MRPPHSLAGTAAAVGVLIGALCEPASAQLLFLRGTVDTQSLAGTGESYGLYFQLLDNPSTPNSSLQNSTRIAVTSLGGGNPGGPTEFEGGALPDPSGVPGSFILQDQNLFNYAWQPFVPGDTLVFEATLTGVRAAFGPDTLSMGITRLDKSEIPTTGLYGFLVEIDLDLTRPDLRVHRSDLSSTTLDIPLPQVQVAVIPEPAALPSLVVILTAALLIPRLRRL